MSQDKKPQGLTTNLVSSKTRSQDCNIRLCKAEENSLLKKKVEKIYEGPFQIGNNLNSSDSLSSSNLEHPTQSPMRLYDCCKYETCLKIAAALNWESFTCYGCRGEVNQSLLWRAQQEVHKDKMAKAICDLPDPKERKIENINRADVLKILGVKA